MGYGGDLFWTVLAKEIYKKHKKKVVFIKNGNPVFSIMWIKNPHISEVKDDNTFVIDFTGYNFGNEIKKNNHYSKQRCNHFKVEPRDLIPILNYTVEEENKISNLLMKLPKNFVCIEPNAKTTWTKNKLFAFHKWQKIVDELRSKNIKVVQVGITNSRKLNNVIDIRSQLKSIRETGCLIKYCDLFISTEGGLTNISSANNNKCLSIVSPMFNPSLIDPKIENYKYIWIHSDKHKGCCKINKCEECRKLMNNYEESNITKKIFNMLKV